MASLTGQTVSSTYDGLLKTDDNDILGAAPKEITDGLGNGSGMTLSTTGDVSIAGDLTVDGAILDSNGVPGASGQILSSTVTGTDWVDLSEISGVDGSGTANYIAKWTDGDTIGNSVIYDNGTNVGIGTANPAYPLEIYDGASRVIRAGSSFVSIDSTGSETSPSLIFEGDADTGLFHPASNNLAFSVAGTERMRIKSFGDISFRDTSANEAFYWDASTARLGLGTTSPQTVIHANDSGGATLRLENPSNFVLENDSLGNIEFYSNDSSTGGTGVKGKISVVNELGFGQYYGMAFYTGRVSGGVNVLEEAMRINTTGNVGIGISAITANANADDLQIGDGTGGNRGLTITAQNNSGAAIYFGDGDDTDIGSIRYDNSNNSMKFFTNATERMRIDSSGNVGIGTSTVLNAPSSGRTVLTIGGSTSNFLNFSNAGSTRFGGIYTDATQMVLVSDTFLKFETGSPATERMRLQTNGDLHVDGDVIAYSTTISDQRLKDDVQTIDNALDKVSNLRGVSYTWNNGNRKGQKDLGLIAQEVEQVLPELVREKEMPMIDGGTYKTVDYEKIVGVLIEAVKELTDKVNKLEAK